MTTVPDTRSRFVRRQWARRWLTWRYLLAAVVVIVLVGGGLYTVYFSSALQVQGVQVTGEKSLSEKQILEAADVPTGGALARLDVDQIAYRVRSLAAVKSADVTRKWPHDVRIEVTERVPVAVVQIGTRWHHLDDTGAVFGSFAKAPGGLPQVRTDSDADPEALAEAAHVVASFDDTLVAIVDHVEVRTVDQISLALKDGRSVEWGSAEDSDDKAAVLADLLQQKGKEYDVSVPGRPVVRS